jgi:peptidoglycan/xylan/chitin deacetylase (PgdA/CDA1 family)
MKNRNIQFFIVLLILPLFCLSGISFRDLNLSGDDQLLFRADFEGRHAVFLSKLADMSMQQLTAFPDKLQLIDNGKTILVLNHFGVSMIPVSGGLPSPLPGYPSFSKGYVPLKGRLQEFAVSGDGRWVLYIEPTSPAHGNLLITDISSGEKWLVSERVELPASDFPARWSADSRLFVYSKGGRLFYFPIINDLSALIDERFRMIGAGEITSVLWGQNGEFYYFVGNTLYQVINPELFTRTIYGDFLSIGSVAAILPVNFDSGFDRYWIAPDSKAILINKKGNGFYIFLLGENQNNTNALPYITIPQGEGNFNVFWPSAGPLTITSSVQNEISVWRFEIGGRLIRPVTTVNIPISTTGLISPDGTRAVFWGEGGLELWDYTNWRLIQRVSREPVYSCVWNGSRQLICGDGRFIEEINLSGAAFSRRLICLSGADEFGFEETSRAPSRLLARMGSEWYASDGISPWSPVTGPQVRQVSLSSQRYRVFLETQFYGHYKNIPMVRNVYSTDTVSIVSNHSAGRAFTLGRQTQIALCFDLYDDDTGLTQVLAALRRRGIKATFFLNGDFIRRNPLAASFIAANGHETASLFYAPIDFSDSRYRVTRDFIVQGLARNEDEFHRATGRELTTLWHPPFYRTSDLINTAASASGYFTVERTIDPGDWLSREEAIRLSLRQISPSQMIDQIIERKAPDAIVPVRLGLLGGGRDEYLFQRIDVLLDALIRSGCEIVLVSAITGKRY